MGDHMNNLKTGKLIQECRKKKNLTQKELAEKLFITDKAISKWERGLSFPDITMLTELSNILDVSLEELLNGEYIPKKEDKKLKKEVNKIVYLTSIILLIIILLIQSLYLVLTIKGYEYIFDALFYINNILILLFIGIILLRFKYKKITYSLIIMFFVINCVFMYHNGFNRKSIIKFNNKLSHIVVLKKDLKTNEIIYYKPVKGLFVKESKSLGIVKNDLKLTWLTNDICEIIYDKQVFVATYGKRNQRERYSYVSQFISGRWQGNDIELIADGNITVIKNNKKEVFENWHQFGMLALVLYDDHIPKYVIALDDNAKVDNKTELIKKGGNIIIHDLTSDNTLPQKLNCIINKDNLNDYKIVDISPYSYKILNEKLYIEYDNNTIIKVPGIFNNINYNDYNYQISKEKTIFYYTNDDKTYLVYSDDAGINWETVELDDNATIVNIHFLNKDIGYMLKFYDTAMMTAYGKILKTEDGGKTWFLISNGIEDTFKTGSQILFINEYVGFLTMPKIDDSLLYQTEDGGKTWFKVKLPKGKIENYNWDDVYDFYDLPYLKNGILYLNVYQGNDGEYNGGDYVTYYSQNNGLEWTLKK